MLRKTTVFLAAAFALAVFAPLADARGGGGGGRGGGRGGAGTGGATPRARTGKKATRGDAERMRLQDDAIRRDNQRRARHLGW